MVFFLVALFLIVVLAIDVVFHRRWQKATSPSVAPGRGDSLHVPQGVFFHPGHTWARLQGDDSVNVGTDDFLQKALGPVDAVQLPAVGQKVTQGQPVILMTRAGRTVSVVSPVTGTVSSVNERVLAEPALMSHHPYSDGWLFSVTPERLAENLGLLTVAESAVDWIRGEIVRLREFLVSHSPQPALVGETMLDGGLPAPGAVVELEPSALKDFENEFLR